jgi:hypothetical protein
MRGRIGQVMTFVRDSSALRPEGEDFDHGFARTASGTLVRKQGIGSTVIDGEGESNAVP